MNQSKNVIQERQKRLFDYITKHNSIKVSDASRMLQVSELTVRRDLAELEKKNLVQRFHGGAALNTSTADYDVVVEEKKILNEHIKNCIGKKGCFTCSGWIYCIPELRFHNPCCYEIS